METQGKQGLASVEWEQGGRGEDDDDCKRYKSTVPSM